MRTILWMLAAVLLTAQLAEVRAARPAPEAGQGAATLPTTTRAADESPQRQFEQLLNGVKMEGSYTQDGREGIAGNDRYVISSSRYLGADRFFISVQVQYGRRSFTVPLVVKVLFAGDTPVITLDDLFVPGAGTFSARVVFHDQRYAGTWQGRGEGGHLWGTITRLPTTQPSTQAATQPASETAP